MFSRVQFILKKYLETKHLLKIANASLVTPSSRKNFVFDIPDLLNISDINKKIIHDANMLVKGVFQIYNYKEYKQAFPDWQKDPVSNYQIKNKPHCLLISSSKLIGLVDIKNYWEQSNQHWLLTLGEAYTLTGNESYAERIVDLIVDWCIRNPCAKTVNWKCTMDTAIRLCNWVAALAIVQNSNAFIVQEEFLFKQIILHIDYISCNLENQSTYRNNHYLSDLVGLIWGTSFLLKNYNVSDRFKEIQQLAIKELEKEIQSQIQEDGFDYENSTYYHCFVTELMTTTLYMLKSNSYCYSEQLETTVLKMFKQCQVLGALKGYLPLIGDQDSSRLFLLYGCFDIDRNNFGYLLNIGSKLFQNRLQQPIPMCSGGIYQLATDNLRCFVKCAFTGTGGKGTHDHNDQLSVVVLYKGNPLFIDPGTGIYTRSIELRNKFRSTAMHNTIVIEDQEQKALSENVFQLNGEGISRCIQTGESCFAGEFVYSSGLKHIRRVKILDQEIKIIDQVTNLASNLLIKAQFLSLYHKEDIEIIPNGMSIKTETGIIYLITRNVSKVLLEEVEYSPTYGCFKTGTRINLVLKDNECEIRITEKI